MTANLRFQAIVSAGSRTKLPSMNGPNSHMEQFASAVFTKATMEKMLPAPIYKNLCNAMDGIEEIKLEYAEPIALAVKEWASSFGATHYTHWFQPLTGMAAEKHDSFLDWKGPDHLVENFSGKQLLRGEPDASSFPSGGLRTTYEARGYTVWDPSSPIFLWQGGDGVTLCIPCIFFSWTGDVLDCKIPLLRSIRSLSSAVLRLLRLTGVPAFNVQTTIGLEQEYFVVDRALRSLRPDLLLVGRTLFGAPSSKGQELQDHYFGTVKDRILAYMQDFELAALRLGIPVKTRHNEVAPAQHEVAPVFEEASKGIDHNLLLMELMRQIAVKHNLSCLLHEKPFAGLNGSGKHCNWSLATDTGYNLLDPSDTPENNLHFLVILTAILSGVQRHARLLRAAIGSLSNDYRLGGHEAPPAIISVYLGETLETFLDNIEKEGAHSSKEKFVPYDFGLNLIPALPKDNTDRNRTSPLAFTGNKFEFRALGSSSNPSFAVATFNVIVAESLHELMDEIEKCVGSDQGAEKVEVKNVIIGIVRKWLARSRSIRFSGNNYGQEWIEEAARRNLPNLKKSTEAFPALISEETKKAFKGVLTSSELDSRYEIALETYVNSAAIEVKLMIELFYSQLLPAAVAQQKRSAESYSAVERALGGEGKSAQQREWLLELNSHIETAMLLAKKLTESFEIAEKKGNLQEKALFFSDKISEDSHELRVVVDRIEGYIEDSCWPLPKYRELLFII